MSTAFPYFMSAVGEELQALRRHWGWFLGLGIALVILGMLAISFPVLATLTTVEIFGYLLVIGAVVEIISGFWGRRWGGFFLHLLCGLLYLFVGAVLIERPDLGASAYTYLLAVFLVASGLFRMVYAAFHRIHGWFWFLMGGIISFGLGMLIWRILPLAAFWVIGTFVGVDLIFNGWSWIMLALGLRNIPAEKVSGTV